MNSQFSLNYLGIRSPREQSAKNDCPLGIEVKAVSDLTAI